MNREEMIKAILSISNNLNEIGAYLQGSMLLLSRILRIEKQLTTFVQTLQILESTIQQANAIDPNDAQITLLPKLKGQCDTYSVSYTHLDVYKRQG